ncbi:MAG TPA: hypothetical protein VK449_05760 [Anaerolineales bacterium]|nr:hypothetical protein [Anaerolineales bacterium]
MPSILSANLLYLATMLLLLVLGGMMQSVHFTWGLMASEALLILLPTLVFLRHRHVPLREGARLQPIRPVIGLLCLVLGLTTFLVGGALDALMAQLSGLSDEPIRLAPVADSVRCSPWPVENPFAFPPGAPGIRPTILPIRAIFMRGASPPVNREDTP